MLAYVYRGEYSASTQPGSWKGKAPAPKKYDLLAGASFELANRQHGVAIRKEFFFLNERSWNVVENKGSLWKTSERSWNVYENTGT
jgi:hypothetical protein